MVGEADLADDARAFRPGLQALKRDALLHDVALGAVQAPQEVEMPPGAAELAVGDRREPDLLLLLDDALDLAVLDRLEVGGADLALGALLARLLQGGRAQQAADVIGAERRFGAFHGSLSNTSIVGWVEFFTRPNDLAARSKCWVSQGGWARII